MKSELAFGGMAMPPCQQCGGEHQPKRDTMDTFNSLVQRFDFLTFYTHDQDTPAQILAWYRQHDVPIVASEFEEVGRALGYNFDTQST